jgi:hypothetical protein
MLSASEPKSPNLSGHGPSAARRHSIEATRPRSANPRWSSHPWLVALRKPALEVKVLTLYWQSNHCYCPLGASAGF